MIFWLPKRYDRYKDLPEFKSAVRNCRLVFFPAFIITALIWLADASANADLQKAATILFWMIWPLCVYALCSFFIVFRRAFKKYWAEKGLSDDAINARWRDLVFRLGDDAL